MMGAGVWGLREVVGWVAVGWVCGMYGRWAYMGGREGVGRLRVRVRGNVRVVGMGVRRSSVGV
jgi:hypothetical protein